MNLKPAVIFVLTITFAGVTIGQATRPAAPPSTQPTAEHDAASAPVIVVWSKPDPATKNAARVEYAVWADGMIIFRRTVAHMPDTLVLGQLDPQDVRIARHNIASAGFYRHDSLRLAEHGTMIMMREDEGGSTMLVDCSFERVSEDPASPARRGLGPHTALWNTIVDSVTSLREVIESEVLTKHLNDQGEYRGYNSRHPERSWWITDSGSIWKRPSSRPSTQPAAGRPAGK